MFYVDLQLLSPFELKVTHPDNSNETIFTFSQATPTSMQHIGFAAGPFHVLLISAWDAAGDEPDNSSQPLWHSFCLPGLENQLTAAVRLRTRIY